MSDLTQELDDSPLDDEAPESAPTDDGAVPADQVVHVDEETPDGGVAERPSPRASKPAADAPEPEEEPEAGADVDAPGVVASDDDEPPPELVWYVLKVQSSREDTIASALQRRVKIQGLERFFGKNPDGSPRIVVPTEKITEIRNNKKRIVERKTYPGYIMVQMELNEKTWFLVRETPGVGDFVGAHGTPTKMTDAEVNQMLHQEEEKTTAESPKVRIDVERGDRVKIKDGPFENFEGTVEEVIEGRGLVKVMLIIFNRPTPVDLEYWQLERI
jgi:transcriptional antiterminator NusG